VSAGDLHNLTTAMTPEMLTAVASLATFVVIAVTAAVAIIQLRHISASNQLTGVMKYIEFWESDRMQRANVFIQEELPKKLRDPDYRRELWAIDVDRNLHPELIAADWCEQAGSYIKYGLLREAQFLDLAGGYIERIWPVLKEVVAIRRVAFNSSAMYENFEYLAALSQRLRERRRTTNYPRHVPRLLSDADAPILAGSPPDKARQAP
jgi:hypothetical protein